MARQGAALYPPALPTPTAVARSTRCRACLHPDRAEIDLALSAGHECATVARQHNLNPRALALHKARHIASSPLSAASRLKADVDRLCEAAEKALTDAQSIPDPSARVQAVTRATMALRSALDLAARIRGELSNSSGTMAKTHLGMTLQEAREKLDALAAAESVRGPELARQAADFLRMWNEAHPDNAHYVEPQRVRRLRSTFVAQAGRETGG